MKTAALLGSRFTTIAISLLLAAVWGTFALSHITGFQHTGDWTLLLFCASETLVATLFVMRSEPAAVSVSPFDWSIAIASTLAPFLFAPSGDQLSWYGRGFIVAGVLIQIFGLLSLNRSFGLVAARRTIKTGGIYRLVRHPLYASYLLTYVGYVLINGSVSNMVICLIAASLLILRMLREEQFLARDADYRFYMRQVKYRLLPMVF